MKFLLSSAAALLLAATTLAVQAQAPAAPRMVSKDELRICMNTEADLATRRAALMGRAEANRAEGTAITAEAADMSQEQKAVEGNEMKMDRFNRKVKAHNARVAAHSANVEALRGDLEGLNKGLVAYNASCGGISFSREDKEAILKEREAAAEELNGLPMPTPPSPAPARVAVIGGGPAGLMAAEVLAQGGAGVDLYDAMPSVGRKFLLAGRGGLNLTHSEPAAPFLQRYGQSSEDLRRAVEAFDGAAVREWATGLGIGTFVGTSGRVFPTDMKAAPLLRAWLHRLRVAGVRIHARHRWTGWSTEGGLDFATPAGQVTRTADATVLALGGASWARLGSDGAWVPWLQARGVHVAPLQPANCGFDIAPTGAGRTGWSEHLRSRFAGQPVKPVAAFMADDAHDRQQGEFVLTDTGIEGSLVYAFSGRLRDAIAAHGRATWYLDLLPQHSAAQVLAEVSHPRGPRSLSTHLKSRLGLQGLKMALLHELLAPEQLHDPARLAQALKALPLVLARPRPLDEAISTAGGVPFAALDAGYMLRVLPGVFCAGEMLDWEAPTGGYLLTACLATGRAAAQGALLWLDGRRS